MLDVSILLVLIIPLKLVPYLRHESLPISMSARARVAHREHRIVRLRAKPTSMVNRLRSAIDKSALPYPIKLAITHDAYGLTTVRSSPAAEYFCFVCGLYLTINWSALDWRNQIT